MMIAISLRFKKWVDMKYESKLRILMEYESTKS